MFDIENELKKLPGQPGVYIMHDKKDRIIYIGKAKILKNRVRQYFMNLASHTPKVRAMVSHIAYFEYIVTDSEVEALMLECNLIKKHKPKYNILLKDDKHYPYIKVTMNEAWPRIFMTRTLKDDGAKYFGPYMGSTTVKNMLDIVQKIFKPPLCKRKFPQDIGVGRPCLNYHIKTCFAPCRGDIPEEEYRKVFSDICAFLDGDHHALLKEMKEEMEEASKELDFERAASLRDRIRAISAVDEKQKVLNSDKQNDKDIIALENDGERSFVEVFFVRKGKLSGRENYRIEDTAGMENREVMTDFIKQFYRDAVFFPDEIITQYETDDAVLIGEWLSGMRGAKVVLTCPKRGEKAALVEMTYKNAVIAMNNFKMTQMKAEEKKNAAYNIAEILGLDKPVRIIESFDISNISGADNVASMVVFENGLPIRSRYRKFRIKSFEGADDYKAMQEVIYRRLNEAREEKERIAAGEMNPKDAKFLPLPDVFFLDGGAGHVSAVMKILEATETDIPVFGMVKNDKHQTRGLVSPNGEIGINQAGAFFRLMTRIQDEVHRSAISYHRSLREKITSELDDIPGIGEKRKMALLSHFGSVEKIKNAAFEELLAVDGINKSAAQSIIDHYKG